MFDSRVPSRLAMCITLTQSDTTVGFLSQNHQKLCEIKSRDLHKPFVTVFASFKELNTRVPAPFKKQVRRAKANTFIVKNFAFRVVKEPKHLHFLSQFGWMYSTSANKKGHDFERSFCEEKSDIIIYQSGGFRPKAPSRITRLHKNVQKRLR